MNKHNPERVLIHRVRELLEERIEQGDVEHTMAICEFMLDIATNLAESALCLSEKRRVRNEEVH